MKKQEKPQKNKGQNRFLEAGSNDNQLISRQYIKMEKQNKKNKSTSGRWTRVEHEKFLQALEKYGRDWVKVQKKIKTRTLPQIRSHAQKVFLNMSQNDIKAFIGSDDESFNNDANLEFGLEKMENSEIPTNFQKQQKIQKNASKNQKTTSSHIHLSENIKLSLLNQQTLIPDQPKLLIFKFQQSNEEQNNEKQNFESIFFQMLKQNEKHFLEGGDFLSLICKEKLPLFSTSQKQQKF